MPKTVEAWDGLWRSHPNWGLRGREDIFQRVEEIVRTLPTQKVVEFGFGHLGVAKMVGSENWLGYDLSPVAVERAGFREIEVGDGTDYHAQQEPCLRAEAKK